MSELDLEINPLSLEQEQKCVSAALNLIELLVSLTPEYQKLPLVVSSFIKTEKQHKTYKPSLIIVSLGADLIDFTRLHFAALFVFFGHDFSDHRRGSQ